MEQNFTIKNITKNSTNLEVDWSDGKKSKFNYLWLRDNCPTAHDKDSRHRMFNILNVSNKINPKKFTINNEGKLELNKYTKPAALNAILVFFIVSGGIGQKEAISNEPF